VGLFARRARNARARNASGFTGSAGAQTTSCAQIGNRLRGFRRGGFHTGAYSGESWVSRRRTGNINFQANTGPSGVIVPAGMGRGTILMSGPAPPRLTTRTLAMNVGVLPGANIMKIKFPGSRAAATRKCTVRHGRVARPVYGSYKRACAVTAWQFFFPAACKGPEPPLTTATKVQRPRYRPPCVAPSASFAFSSRRGSGKVVEVI